MATLTFKFLFIDKETDDERILSTCRDLAAGEQLPRLGDSVSFNMLEIMDMHFVVSDVNYRYDVNSDLDDVLITAESDEYYDRRRAEYWPESDEEFDDVNIDLGDFDADSDDFGEEDVEGQDNWDDFGNEFGNDPDDDFDDDTDKIKI